MNSFAQDEARADRADHAGLAGETGALAQLKHRFDSGAVGADQVGQSELPQLVGGEGERGVAGGQQMEAAERGVERSAPDPHRCR